jgi:hypothetical protein
VPRIAATSMALWGGFGRKSVAIISVRLSR